MNIKATTLQSVHESGWRSGFSNLLRKELRGWWGTRTWMVQALIWLFVVNGMLAIVLFADPGEASSEGFVVFSLFTGMFASLGAIIFIQGRIVGEKQSGTAAWILSKPVSRTAFLLSKLLADGLGFFVTVIVLQGAVAYAQFATAGIAPSAVGFAAAMGLLFVNLLFYVALTLMLGAFFDSRAAVIGTAVFILFAQVQVAQSPTGQFLPGSLPFAAAEVLAGNPLPTVVPLVGSVVLTAIFVAAAFRRFGCEEF